VNLLLYETNVLEPNGLRVDPEHAVSGVVDGDAVGPVDVLRNDLGLLTAVHANTTDERVVVVPVRPEHVAALNSSTNNHSLTHLFSPLGKLAGRAIYFADVFFFIFFIFFLMVDFLAPVAQTLMEQSSPKFQY